MAHQTVRHVRECRIRYDCGLLQAAMTRRARIFRAEITAHISRIGKVSLVVDRLCQGRRNDIPELQMLRMTELRKIRHPRLLDGRNRVFVTRNACRWIG